MGLILFGLMIVVPILEIGVFIVVGRFIGLWPTLAGIVLTALIGSAIIRHQGLAIITKAKQTMNAGQAPVGEVVEGLALLIAGVLLLTPGFVTDSFGFLLLVPGLRRSVAAMMLAQATRRAEVRVHAADGGRPGGAGASGRPGSGRPGSGRSGPGVTIEGEWEDLSESRQDDPAGAGDPPESGRGWGGGSGSTGDDDRDSSPPVRSAQG